MLYEALIIEGRNVKIWPGQTPASGYSISDNGGWLDGIYDSRDAAILGFRLSISENGYGKLLDLRDRVNRNKNHPRKIETTDFE